MESTNPIICNERLLQHIRSNLSRFDIQTHERNGFKHAAVAITVVNTANGSDVYGIPHKRQIKDPAIILTRRSLRLRNHAGQWALPGGRTDEDESPEDTALRELEEEVGLKLDHDSVIGRLDDFTTRSGFVISPVVAWGGDGADLTPNPAEVESVHCIPIREFLREDAPILEEIPESENPVLFMPIGKDFIAAPTAALLYQFREVAILGKDVRVAHYEQPLFAWK